MNNLDEELAYREQINEAIQASKSLNSSSWDPMDSEFMLALKLQEMLLENDGHPSFSEWHDTLQEFHDSDQDGEYLSCESEASEEEFSDALDGVSERDHLVGGENEPRGKGILRGVVFEGYCSLYFKGVSEKSEGRARSGIGVVVVGADGKVIFEVQKRLEFCVDGCIVEQLALVDGVLGAIEVGVGRIRAFTDSDIVYDQIARGRKLENQLQTAMRQRILVHVQKLDNFVLSLIPSHGVKKAQALAKEAVAKPIALSKSSDLRSLTTEMCSICCEEKTPADMVTVNCFHKFCCYCMGRYVDGKLQASQVPIRCPQVDCSHYISAEECKSFLPSTCFESLLKTLAEANIPESKRVYCPYPNCSAMFDNGQDESLRGSSSSHAEESRLRRVECPECHRLFCAECSVPWHSAMSCEEYQSLPADERNYDDITLHRLAENRRWRRCRECRRMIELTQGCYHMTCWCGHEFCYACGAEYTNKQQTCHCAYWEENNIVNPPVRNELPNWTYYDPNFYNETGHEQSQLALLQRFLSEDFTIEEGFQTTSRHSRHEDSFDNALGDLHQVPFLGSFVSAISDTSYDYFPYG